MIVSAEKVFAGSGMGPVGEDSAARMRDGKVVAPRCTRVFSFVFDREPEDHKRLELYDLEIHQEKCEPDYHRLKTMVKRSIEQEIRNKNFGARSGNFEKNAVVKNQGTKQSGKRILGDCWQWETNGQCVKGNNCSFRHGMNKRG